MAITKEQIEEVLKTCQDPEIHVDVLTLGLIYKIEIKNNNVEIVMTLTTPFCPYGPMLIEEVKAKVKQLKGVKDVEVHITFDPPWKPSEDIKAMLGLP